MSGSLTRDRGGTRLAFNANPDGLAPGSCRGGKAFDVFEVVPETRQFGTIRPGQMTSALEVDFTQETSKHDLPTTPGKKKENDWDSERREENPQRGTPDLIGNMVLA